MQHPIWQHENTNKLSADSRAKAFRSEAEANIANAKRFDPDFDFFLDNKLCKNISINIHSFRAYNTIYLYIYDVDLPTVIDHICGPIHRKYGIDWKLTVITDIQLRLTAKCNMSPYTAFDIELYEGSMRSCNVVEVKIGERTDEEIAKALIEAAKRDKIEYRIDCSGGDE